MGRPAPPTSPDIRPARGDINGRSLDELSVNPASPNYRSRLPPPPCSRCGEDHVPGHTYDHNYELEAPQRDYVHSIVPPAYEPPPSLPSPSPQRVAIYVGRNDTYVVAVEAAPDWDVTVSFKVREDRLLDLVNLARALQIKVVDKTGGDLVQLEQEHASEHA